VDFIIALGHSGVEKDIEIATKIPEVDVVGRTHAHIHVHAKGQSAKR